LKRYLLDTGIAADYLNRRGGVYARARQHIAEGARLGLCAPVLGELVEVKAITSGEIHLTDGRAIPPGYNTFTHGYALTSHAAQGKTVDAVFLVATARSLPAVHREQFYVSVSRGRDECRVFTDDKELLRRHVTRSSTRLAAVEAIKGTPKPGAIIFARKIAHRVAVTAQRLRQFVAPAHSLQSVA